MTPIVEFVFVYLIPIFVGALIGTLIREWLWRNTLL